MGICILKRGSEKRNMALIHLDTKKRVTLGKLLQGRDVKTFDAEVLATGEILLKPMALIPEHWITKNPKALASLKQGIADEKKGRTRALSEIRKGLKARALR